MVTVVTVVVVVVVDILRYADRSVNITITTNQSLSGL